MTTRQFRIALVGTALFAAACDSGGGPAAPGAQFNRPPTPQEAVPAEVVITPRADTLSGPGERAELGAVVVGTNGSVIAGVPVTWASSAPGVATVGVSSGTVTAVRPGTATIRANAGTASGTATVVVLDPGTS